MFLSRHLAGIAAALLSATAVAGIDSFTLSDDGAALTFRRSDGRTVQAPRTSADQAAFGHARTSPDGRYIGWAAMLPNCCTSYPLPLSIVVHDGERIVRIIGPLAPPAFEWTFSDDSRAVVLKQQFPHGVSPRLFSRVRIRDGAWLGRYECFPDEPDRAGAAAPPRWAAPLADECR